MLTRYIILKIINQSKLLIMPILGKNGKYYKISAVFFEMLLFYLVYEFFISLYIIYCEGGFVYA